MDAQDPLGRLGRLLGVDLETVARRRADFGIFTGRMDEGTALRFERWLACVAAAAEEIGPTADPMVIIRRARELERRRT